jgi:hypothetical protein
VVVRLAAFRLPVAAEPPATDASCASVDRDHYAGRRSLRGRSAHQRRIRDGD